LTGLPVLKPVQIARDHPCQIGLGRILVTGHTGQPARRGLQLIQHNRPHRTGGKMGVQCLLCGLRQDQVFSAEHLGHRVNVAKNRQGTAAHRNHRQGDGNCKSGSPRTQLSQPVHGHVHHHRNNPVMVRKFQFWQLRLGHSIHQAQKHYIAAVQHLLVGGNSDLGMGLCQFSRNLRIAFRHHNPVPLPRQPLNHRGSNLTCSDKPDICHYASPSIGSIKLASPTLAEFTAVDTRCRL
jgi:hypothetical protein